MNIMNGNIIIITTFAWEIVKKSRINFHYTEFYFFMTSTSNRNKISYS